MMTPGGSMPMAPTFYLDRVTREEGCQCLGHGAGMLDLEQVGRVRQDEAFGLRIQASTIW